MLITYKLSGAEQGQLELLLVADSADERLIRHYSTIKDTYGRWHKEISEKKIQAPTWDGKMRETEYGTGNGLKALKTYIIELDAPLGTLLRNKDIRDRIGFSLEEVAELFAMNTMAVNPIKERAV